jgi:hypothetical protein
MGAYRFSLGTRFHWQQAAYEVIRVLPAGSVQLEDIATSATREATIAELVAALFHGDLHVDADPAVLKASERSPGQIQSLDLSDYPQNQVAIARYRLACLQPLLALPPENRTRADVEVCAQEAQAATPSQHSAALGQAPSALPRCIAGSAPTRPAARIYAP